jgi:lipopolysaccharide/colanic/teichoic acid biosynthesis glycosyltransferase
MQSHLRSSSTQTGVRRGVRTDRVPIHPTVRCPRVAEERNGHIDSAASRVVQPETAVRKLFAPSASVRALELYERFGKRLLDVTASILLSVLLLPLLIVIGVALRVTMGSPVVFRQPRVGRNGEIFTIFKFRTMIPDRRKNSADYTGLERRKTHKSPDDPRVTALGRFLRKWSLDELPQLWNVLRGDMSLVGPRPELVTIVESYEPWQHQRHAVKPGLTGLWQISCRRDGLMHEHVYLDLKYINDLSFQADLRIIVNTTKVLFGKVHGF